MPKAHHHAFRVEGDGTLMQLVTSALVSQSNANGIPTPSKGKVYSFIWDTGANGSVITPRVAQELGLTPTGRKTVNAVNATHVVNTYIVDFMLPMNVGVRSVEVTESTIYGIDGLIGMDIISVGDFSISNFKGKTVFTFAMPPFENRTDLLDKANATNKKK